MSPFYDNKNLKMSFAPLRRFGMKLAKDIFSTRSCVFELKQTFSFWAASEHILKKRQT